MSAKFMYTGCGEVRSSSRDWGKCHDYLPSPTHTLIHLFVCPIFTYTFCDQIQAARSGTKPQGPMVWDQAARSGAWSGTKLQGLVLGPGPSCKVRDQAARSGAWSGTKLQGLVLGPGPSCKVPWSKLGLVLGVRPSFGCISKGTTL